MPGTMLVTAGVVLTQAESFEASEPIREGLEVVRLLSDFPTGRVAMICKRTDHASAIRWCKTNGLPNMEVVLVPPERVGMPNDDVELRAIKQQRANGPINLVLTESHHLYLWCGANFQNVLLFSRAGLFNTRAPRRPWGSVVAEVNAWRETEANREQTATK